MLNIVAVEVLNMQSIIQGSGLGPVLYAIYSSDLKAIGKDTVLVKYADDTTLVYPDQTEVSFADEFSNIKEWSKQNRLTINISKTKEIVFHRPNPHRFHAPALYCVEWDVKLYYTIPISCPGSITRCSTAGSLARLFCHRYLLEITLIIYSPSPVSASTYSISLSMLD